MKIIPSLFFLFSSYALASEGLTLEPQVKEEVEKVCGFCHFYDFLDEETELLSLEKIFPLREEMIRRLSLEEGEEGRMPPSRSSLTLSSESRENFILYLRSLEAPSK